MPTRAELVEAVRRLMGLVVLGVAVPLLWSFVGVWRARGGHEPWWYYSACLLLTLIGGGLTFGATVTAATAWPGPKEGER